MKVKLSVTERLEKAIRAKEGFGVKVSPHNGKVPSRITPYDPIRRARDSSTVSRFKALRFVDQYPQLTVSVLFADGTVADDEDVLSEVRASYDETE